MTNDPSKHDAANGDARRDIADAAPALLPRLLRRALSLTRDPAEAEDLAQATYLRMLERSDQFRRGSHLDRWGFTVMANLWRSALRRERSRPETQQDVDTLASAQPTAEDAHFQAQVLDAVDELPSGQRTLVLLVYAEGLSYREAAERLDVPIGTVMSRLHAARSSLVARCS